MTKIEWNPLGEGSVMKVKKLLKYKKLNENAISPTRSHDGDLGYDLYAVKGVTIPAQGGWGATARRMVHTGVGFQFPPGWGGLLKDRSSMASRGLYITGGVIDNGYTGEIIIVLNNDTGQQQRISKGDKIAQMVLIPVANFELEEVDQLITHDDRGVSGFGSTGK